MKHDEFAAALAFALEREQAAVAFYADLESRAAFAAQKATLAEFRLMEEGHVALVRSLQARGEVNLSATAAVDLGLARQLAADEPPPAELDFQQILKLAIKKEERSGDLYGQLAAAALDPELREIFGRLAAEESRHRHYFEALYESEVARDN
ncbi:MAG: hypothetical protein A2Y37_02350 [Spirochaetes bacterium GWB1_60_80]|nr:MAG: hypothetical protein A2Y37_02350 [Spirochaetes bacterium GWB1_60_80]OHD41587.1 MAG: hypothetical protein A2Y35_02490 [Spirochaetes bacterium GWE1_60_18]OHD61492.1 MAG: hypothetical protein A2Y32_02760 [Spirochaetes bacterium GWF1_60_12]HAP43409.1 hypothetical protein [Spirochaetaceae bacterium]HAX37502.1 hypothetical protein [Spirochaetaceae bacterium]